MTELAGLNAILTGASSGLGLHIARALAVHGVNLVLAARSAEPLAALAEELRTLGVTAEPVTCDVREPTERHALVERAVETLGHVDVLVNNAGVEEVIHFERQDPAVIRATIETNLLAPILLTQALLPHLLQRKAGHIVNIASLSGRTGMPYGSVYAGSKAGLCEWGVSVGAELRDRGIAVTNVVPGFVSETGMHARKGRPAPDVIGEVTPKRVAGAVIRALRKRPIEILVNRRPVKPLITLKALSPGAALKVGEASGVVGYLRTLADDRAKQKTGSG